VSSVQFLKNNGTGNFEDVTDATISNYDSQSYIGYTPIIRDFDRNGFLDIFLSDADFSGDNTSAVFLMGGEDGKFTEVGREFLSTVLSGNGGMATVVEGPNDDFFLLAGVQVMSNGIMQENFTLYSLDFL
jgi:hypothetical protein